MGDLFSVRSQESSSSTTTTYNTSEVLDSYNTTISSVTNNDDVGNTKISTGGGGALEALLPSEPQARETTKTVLLISGLAIAGLMVLALFFRK